MTRRRHVGRGACGCESRRRLRSWRWGRRHQRPPPRSPSEPYRPPSQGVVCFVNNETHEPPARPTGPCVDRQATCPREPPTCPRAPARPHHVAAASAVSTDARWIVERLSIARRSDVDASRRHVSSRRAEQLGPVHFGRQNHPPLKPRHRRQRSRPPVDQRRVQSHVPSLPIPVRPHTHRVAATVAVELAPPRHRPPAAAD